MDSEYPFSGGSVGGARVEQKLRRAKSPHKTAVCEAASFGTEDFLVHRHRRHSIIAGKAIHDHEHTHLLIVVVGLESANRKLVVERPVYIVLETDETVIFSFYSPLYLIHKIILGCFSGHGIRAS